jgi:hypothetical protein
LLSEEAAQTTRFGFTFFFNLRQNGSIPAKTGPELGQNQVNRAIGLRFSWVEMLWTPAKSSQVFEIGSNRYLPAGRFNLPTLT